MTQATDTRTLVLERELSHAPEKVWRALTETELLAQWMMQNDFELAPHHKFSFRSAPNPHWDGVISCEVLAIEPPTRLVYRWDALGLESVVTVTLAATATGTKLVLEHAGFKPDQTYAFEGAKLGWGGMLDKLDGVLGGL